MMISVVGGMLGLGCSGLVFASSCHLGFDSPADLCQCQSAGSHPALSRF